MSRNVEKRVHVSSRFYSYTRMLLYVMLGFVCLVYEAVTAELHPTLNKYVIKYR